jgi:transposase
MKQLYYIGVDFHPYQQTVAFCTTDDGEIKYRQFRHSDKKALAQFYRQCREDSMIGVEATGALDWFEKLLFENGLSLRIGNPRLIRRAALSRHKNDYRDAETILDLLLTNRFPDIEPKSQAAQSVLALLSYRHSLVQQKTRLINQMQAVARRKGLPKFRLQSPTAKERLTACLENETEELLLRSRWKLFDALTDEIELIEAELKKAALANEQVRLLRTHSGIGELTALCLVQTLGAVTRFAGKEQVVAFVGLDPLDKSSGEKKRIGKISKKGSRLLRFLLGQAANTTKDKRLREFYRKISRRRGKAQAKVACARKLLINCYIMLREGIDYEEFSRRGGVGLCG